MASGAAKTPSGNFESARSGAPRAQGRVIEYQTYIDGQLRKTRARVKWVDLWTSLTLLGIGLLAYLLLAAVIDHWVVPGGLGFAGRLFLLIGLLAGIGVHLATNLLPFFVRRVNPVYAAAAIERGQPMKNTLVNFLLLRKQPDTLPEPLLEAMKEQAAVRLSAVPGDAPVDRTLLIRLGYVLIAVLVAAVVYALAGPKDAIRSVERVMAPWADLAAPTRVAIEELTPGDVEKRRDDVVEIKVRTRRMRAGDQAAVFYSAGGLPQDDVAVPLRSDDLLHWSAVLPAGGDGLKQDISYYVQTGDAVSPRYRVRVLATPVIGVTEVRYEYPAYTKLPPRTVERQGDLKGLEGTRVVLTAETNQHIRTAHVAFDQARNKDVELTADATQLKAVGGFELSLTKDRKKPLHGSYLLRFTNIDGQENPKPIEHKIEVVPDQPPELKVTEPTSPPDKVLQVPVDGALRIALSAQDPDFQLAGLSVVFDRFGADFREERLMTATAGYGPFSNTYLFVPKSFNLKAGDRLAFRGRATDNKAPQPNVVEGARYSILITGQSGNAQQPPPQGNQGQQQQPNQPPNGQQNAPQQQNQGPPQPQQNGGAPGEPQQGNAPQQGQPQQGPPQQGQPQNGPNQQQPQNAPQQGNPQQNNPQQANPQQNAQQQNQPKNGEQPQQGQSQQGQPQQGMQRPGEAQNQPQNGRPQQGESKPGNPQPGRQQPGQQNGGDDKQPAGGQSQNGDKQPGGGAQNNTNKQAGDGGQGEKPIDPAVDPGGAFEALKKHFDKQAGDQSNKQPNQQPQDQQQQADAQQNQQKQQAGGGQNPQQQPQPGEQKPGDQQPGDQKAGADQMAGKQAGQPKPGEQPGGGRQAGEKQGRQAGEKAGEKNGAEKNGGEKNGADKNNGDKNNTDKHGREQQPQDQVADAGKQQGGAPQGGEAGAGKRGGGEQGQEGGGKSEGNKTEGGAGQKPGDQAGSPGGGNQGMKAQDGGRNAAQPAQQRPGQNEGGREVGSKPTDGGGTGEKKLGDDQKPGDTAGAKPTDSKPEGANSTGMKPAAGEQNQGPKPGGNEPAGDSGKSPSGPQGGQPNSGNPAPDQQGKQSTGGDSGATGGAAPKDGKKPGTQPGEQPPTQAGGAKPSANAQQPAGNDNSGGAKGPAKGEGSPEQQEMSKPRDKTGGGSASNKQESGSDSGKSPSGSRSESDTRGDDSGDRSGKGEEGGGMRSKQQGTGAAGSNSAGDQGAGAANEAGDAAAGKQAGDKVRGQGEKGGESAGSKGQGSQSQPGGEKAGGESRSAQGGGPQNGPGSESRMPIDVKDGSTSGSPGTGGGGVPQGDTPPPPRQAPEPGGDEANLEYTKKVTDLTLDRLKQDLAKGQVDPELLKRFSSREALEQFAKRWDEMRKAAQQAGPQGDVAKKQFQDTLKGLGLRPQSTQQQGARTGDDDFRQVRGARRSEPPAKFADQYRAYTTGIGQGQDAK